MALGDGPSTAIGKGAFMERLQKLLNARGIASRREAETLILSGRVTVDGAPASLGQRADPATQEIRVDGRILPPLETGRVYLMLNKPEGYITTVRDDRGRKTVMDLLGDAGQGLWPVGRLDRDSQGLLLMTNDGAVTQCLTHPSFGVEKVYQVWVSGEEIEEKAEKMAGPLEIDGRPIRPGKVRLLSRRRTGGTLEVRIYEGRNRQVRKMCALFDLQVNRLIRVGEGELQLGDLKSGSWRPLTEEEMAYLHGYLSSTHGK